MGERMREKNEVEEEKHNEEMESNEEEREIKVEPADEVFVGISRAHASLIAISTVGNGNQLTSGASAFATLTAPRGLPPRPQAMVANFPGHIQTADVRIELQFEPPLRHNTLARQDELQRQSSISRSRSRSPFRDDRHGWSVISDPPASFPSSACQPCQQRGILGGYAGSQPLNHVPQTGNSLYPQSCGYGFQLPASYPLYGLSRPLPIPLVSSPPVYHPLPPFYLPPPPTYPAHPAAPAMNQNTGQGPGLHRVSSPPRPSLGFQDRLDLYKHPRYNDYYTDEENVEYILRFEKNAQKARRWRERNEYMERKKSWDNLNVKGEEKKLVKEEDLA